MISKYPKQIIVSDIEEEIKFPHAFAKLFQHELQKSSADGSTHLHFN